MSDIEDLFGSDADDEQFRQPTTEAAEPAHDLEDLFGDDEPQQRPTSSPQDDLFGSDEEGREGDTDQPKPSVGPPIQVEAPLIPRPPRDKVFLLKLTNILGIDPKPFDPATYEAKDMVYVDERGQKRVRMRNTNVIRWRHRTNPDGSRAPESNARYVKWSDGSEQIFLGDEVLNVTKQDISRDRAYLYAVRYEIIEGQAHLVNRMALMPANLKGALHRRLTENVKHQHRKVEKVLVHMSSINPEIEKAEAEKRAEESERLRLRQEREMNKYAAPRSAPRARPTTLTKAYLEDDFIDDADEDYDAGATGYGSEDEGYGGSATDRARAALGGGRRRQLDDREEAEAARRLQSAKRQPPPAAAPASAKRRRYGDEGSDEEEGQEGEGWGSQEPAAKGAGIKARRGVVLSSDEDDD